MTSLAAFGTFLIATCATVWRAYQFFLKQFERRRKEIADKAVAEYVEKNDLEALKAAVKRLEQREGEPS
jgi:hypothetical protein